MARLLKELFIVQDFDWVFRELYHKNPYDGAESGFIRISSLFFFFSCFSIFIRLFLFPLLQYGINIYIHYTMYILTTQALIENALATRR